MRSLLVLPLTAAMSLAVDDPSAAVPEAVRLEAVRFHRVQYASRLTELKRQVADEKGAGFKGESAAASELATLKKSPQFVRKAKLRKFVEAADPDGKTDRQREIGWLPTLDVEVKAVGPAGFTVEMIGVRGGRAVLIQDKPPKGAVVGKEIKLPRMLYWAGEQRKIGGSLVDVARLIDFKPEELADLPK